MNRQMPISAEFWPLLNAACDGTLLATQIQELEAVLDADAAARKVFADHFQLKTAIRFLGRAEKTRNIGLAGVRATFSSSSARPRSRLPPSASSAPFPRTIGYSPRAGRCRT